MNKASETSTPQSHYEQVETTFATPLETPETSESLSPPSGPPSWPRLESKVNDIRRIAYSLVRRDHFGLTSQIKGRVEFKISERFRRRYRRLTSSLFFSLIMIACTAVVLVWFLSRAHTQVRERTAQLAMMSTHPKNPASQPALNLPNRDDLTQKIKELIQSNNVLDSRLHQAQLKNQELQMRISDSDPDSPLHQVQLKNQELEMQISEYYHLLDVARNNIQGLEKVTDDQDRQIDQLKKQLQQLQSPKLLSYNEPQK